MKRLSFCPRIRPTRERWARWKDSVAGWIWSCSPMVLGLTPSGPASISRRKMDRRVSWPRAARSSAALSVSIILILSNYVECVGEKLVKPGVTTSGLDDTSDPDGVPTGRNWPELTPGRTAEQPFRPTGRVQMTASGVRSKNQSMRVLECLCPLACCKKRSGMPSAPVRLEAALRDGSDYVQDKAPGESEERTSQLAVSPCGCSTAGR